MQPPGAWVEPLPEGRVIDPASGLTERDLALILKHLRATRLHEWLSAAHDTSPPSAEPSAATIAPPPAVSAWSPP
jgi:hypothetical protein